MKKILLFSSIIILFNSCSSIKIVKDPFKNSTVVTMDMDHNAHIEGFTKTVLAHGGEYSREIKEGKKHPITVIIKLVASTNIISLSNEAYVKIDDKTMKLELSDIQTGTNVSSGQSTQLNIKSGKMQQVTTVSSSNVLSGKLILTNEAEDLILKAKTLQYRLYFQSDPIDIKVPPSQLEKIKEFCGTTGEEKK
jgi:hypothetical protein